MKDTGMLTAPLKKKQESAELSIKEMVVMNSVGVSEVTAIMCLP